MEQILGNTLFPVGIVLALFAFHRLSAKKQPAPFPPGPKGLPLLGNALTFPLSYPYITFAKWSQKYGGIIHAQILGLHIIILNDARYATEMLENKGKIYSDRPKFMMAGELVGWSESPALSQAGPRWSEHRKQMAAFMGSRAKVEALEDILQSEVNRVLKKLLSKPEDYVRHFRDFAGSTGIAVNYGYRVRDHSDPYLSLAGLAMEHFSEMIVTNAFAVDTFPILRYVPAWFPGSGWKKKAIRYRAVLNEMVESPYNWAKQQMESGTPLPHSFITHILGEKKLEAKEERLAQWSAAGAYAGMADTTSAGVAAFVLAMTRHIPELLKAQAEIDAVVGANRLPIPADRTSLPYFEGVYLETFRLYSLGPLGVPHTNREDDIQDGYFIPKGSIVIANSWRFNRDAKTYPDPEVFSPERYLERDGKQKQKDPRDSLFGYGRRKCPGQFLGDAAMWLLAVNIIAVFDIRPPMKDGRPVIPSPDFEDTSICYPKPFECLITPRSKLAESLVRNVLFHKEDLGAEFS